MGIRNVFSETLKGRADSAVKPLGEGKRESSVPEQVCMLPGLDQWQKSLKELKELVESESDKFSAVERVIHAPESRWVLMILTTEAGLQYLIDFRILLRKDSPSDSLNSLREQFTCRVRS